MSNKHSICIRRPIEGHPGYYIGKDGTVWSRRCKRGRTGGGRGSESYVGGSLKAMKLQTLPNGYMRVIFTIEGIETSHLVHRLVLEAFVGPCPEGMEACHNDRDRTNNHVNNLRWDTHKNNCIDSCYHGTARRKLTSEQVVEMRRLDSEEKIGCTRLGRRFNVSEHTAFCVISRRIWKHV